MRTLIAGINPTGGPFQNPRSRNLGPQNKGPPTLFVLFWGWGTLIWRTQIPRTRILEWTPRGVHSCDQHESTSEEWLTSTGLALATVGLVDQSALYPRLFTRQRRINMPLHARGHRPRTLRAQEGAQTGAAQSWWYAAVCASSTTCCVCIKHHLPARTAKQRHSSAAPLPPPARSRVFL